jgi:hypothetical protein
MFFFILSYPPLHGTFWFPLEFDVENNHQVTKKKDFRSSIQANPASIPNYGDR